MKICHFGDTHLGAGGSFTKRAESGLTIRQEDVIKSFIEAVDRIIEIRPDICIHAGDLFDTVRPLNRIIRVAVEQFHRMAEENGIPTVIISGNHDAPKQPHIGAAIDIMSTIDNLSIASHGHLEKYKIGDACIFALPHCLTTAIQSEELLKCRPDGSARFHVMIAHGVAAGMPEFAMADLGEQELPMDELDQFDYLALGHFHNYSQVGTRAYYCGSSERLSQAERESEKGFIEVDLDPFEMKFHAVDARAMLDLEVIDATGKRGDELMETISERLKDIDTSNKIIRVKVEGVTEETMKTIPTKELAKLKQDSFSLDVSFRKSERSEPGGEIGKAAIGQLDSEFKKYLQTVDLKGFDEERLKREALRHLGREE